MENFGDDLANCIYHVWWPAGDDPYYNYNTVPVQTRKNFYNVAYAPSVCLDGALEPDPYPYSVATLTNLINQRLTVASPMTIDCSGIAGGGGIQLSVDVTVENPQPAGDYRLFVALIEKYLYLAGGTYQDHHNVFRWMSANATPPHGEPIDLSSAGAQHFEYVFPFDPIYQVDNLAMTVWVQNMSNRGVLQSSSALVPVPYFVMAQHTGPSGQIGGVSEVVTYTGEIENLGAFDDVYDVTVTGVPAGWAYSYTTPSGTYSGPSALPLVAGDTAAISLDLDSQGNAGPATVTMHFASQAQPSVLAELEFQKINGVQVLIVDDDGGAARETYLEAALDAAGVTYGTYDRDGGAVTSQNLQDAAQSVFWMCGTTYGLQTPSVTQEDRDALASYMDAGGNVCLSGSNVTYDIGEPTSPNYSTASEQWMADYFKVDHEYNHSFSFTVDGTPGDPIGDGFTGMLFESSAVNGNYQDTPDGIAALPGGELVFTWAGTIARGDACVRYAGGYKSILFGAGIEGIREQADRHEIVARIIEWFGGSVAVEDPQGTAPLVRLAQNVPNPFRPSTSIHYELGRPGAVSLRVYDVQGRLVRELVRGHQDAVAHSVVWDGTDDAGRAVSSGVYFYRLEAPGVTETHRMVLSR